MLNTSTELRSLTDAEIDAVAGGLLPDLSGLVGGLPIVGPIISPILEVVEGLLAGVGNNVPDLPVDLPNIS